MKILTQTSGIAKNQRDILRLLIGQILICLELTTYKKKDELFLYDPSEYFYGETLISFSGGNYEITNDPIVDEEVNIEIGLLPKPSLAINKTVREEGKDFVRPLFWGISDADIADGTASELGQVKSNEEFRDFLVKKGVLFEEGKNDFIEINKPVKDILLVRELSVTMDSKNALLYRENLIAAWFFIFEDNTSMVFDSRLDPDGGILELWKDFESFTVAVQESAHRWKEGQTKVTLEDLDGNEVQVVVNTIDDTMLEACKAVEKEADKWLL
jgi:hypothetical protein